jgi:hypothetical protein
LWRVKPNQDQTPEVTAIGCDVVAHALVRVPLAAMADLRRQPGPASAPSLPANFLKHTDEQSVAGLAAVCHAVYDHGLQGTDFTRWGVLGAPRFPGRPLMIPSIKRFLAEGAWGVSPHTVPHRSLHSLSGTISQALKIHGPNFGVGGGNGAAEEIVFAALALLECQSLPGVWMVVTAQEPEGALDGDGNGPPEKCVRALALALTRSRPDWRGLRLSLEIAAAVKPGRRDYFKLFTMLEQVVRERVAGRGVTQPWQNCARLTLAWAAAPTEPRASGSATDSPVPIQSRFCMAMETPR